VDVESLLLARKKKNRKRPVAKTVACACDDARQSGWAASYWGDEQRMLSRPGRSTEPALSGEPSDLGDWRRSAGSAAA
jgi:hypothetical protein